jgi:GTP cyclohydrolase II
LSGQTGYLSTAMFTYLDPDVRERLIQQGSLVRIDARGRKLDPRAQPIELAGVSIRVKWYASVRSTELSEIEDLASTLRESGGQHLFSVLASSMAVNSVLVIGKPSEHENPLVRVHSSCLTGDVFGSCRCECGPQLASALERISQDPAGGFLVYMAGHEGRGIGLWAKAATYLLQDAGEDTYQANRSLGLPDDSRDFSDAASLLQYFVGDRPLRLLTNNPKKIADLAALGLHSVEPVKHVIGVNEWNRRYLDAKRDWGHRIGSEDLETSESS